MHLSLILLCLGFDFVVMDDGFFYVRFPGMRMPDPLSTFAELVKGIRVAHPDFAYLHVLEPTTHHRPDGEGETGSKDRKDSNKLLRDIWGDGVYITNCDFGRESAIETVEREGGLVSFARHFISNVSK